MKSGSVLAVAVTFLVARTALAQGGPPFRTDDPDTPGNRQWEINLGFIGDRNAFQGSYALPNFDVNYGIGDRIQLKLELPMSVEESRFGRSNVAAGLGNSLFGFKWRFYEQRPKNFAMSFYPQLVVNNPTRSVSRGIVEPGPQLLLPVEANFTLGPIRTACEVGYWLTTKGVPNPWVEGLLVGHEFKGKTELYLEFYHQHDIVGITHQTTLGVGGRRPIAASGRVLFIGMIGRGLTAATAINEQPAWIAYIGVQFRLGSKESTQ